MAPPLGINLSAADIGISGILEGRGLQRRRIRWNMEIRELVKFWILMYLELSLDSFMMFYVPFKIDRVDRF